MSINKEHFVVEGGEVIPLHRKIPISQIVLVHKHVSALRSDRAMKIIEGYSWLTRIERMQIIEYSFEIIEKRMPEEGSWLQRGMWKMFGKRTTAVSEG